MGEARLPARHGPPMVRGMVGIMGRVLAGGRPHGCLEVEPSEGDHGPCRARNAASRAGRIYMLMSLTQMITRSLGYQYARSEMLLVMSSLS